MDERALRTEIGNALRGFIANVVIFNTALAQQLGLGPSDSQFLTLLTNHGPLTAGQLATRSGLTTGTVTGVLDRLERGGYVRRDRDATDRRKVIVSPVPEAIAATAEHYRHWGEQVERVLERRDAAELQAIAGFLADLDPERASPDDDRTDDDR